MMRRWAKVLAGRSFRLIAGLAAIALIAYADLSLNDAIPLALLYLAPIAMMSTVLKRWQIALLGCLCMLVAEYADGYPWTFQQGIPRDALYFFAYTAAGLYVSEMVSRRTAERSHLAVLEAEMEARRGVEEQLRLVIANSSIAIVTSDELGVVLQANEAAERLFLGDAKPGPPRLRQSPLSSFLPSLARVQLRKQGWEQVRTMMQCQGLRFNQEPFLADVWFSTYPTSTGGRLTAMIVDSSVEMRDREEATLEQVLVGSRLAVGALSHEIRNICAAISVVQQNLLAGYPAAGSAPAQVKEFEALQQLVAALERVASVELAMVRRQGTKLEIETFLRELYIVIHPSVREAGIALDWWVDAGLPLVWADQHGLLQVFLNLLRNAETALALVKDPRISISAVREQDRVLITVQDNGPGVSDPEQLFRPFGSDRGPLVTQAPSGLGLYLSRAMMRSFRGDLRYQPGGRGATFAVEVVVAGVER